MYSFQISYSQFCVHRYLHINATAWLVRITEIQFCSTLDTKLCVYVRVHAVCVKNLYEDFRNATRTTSLDQYLERNEPYYMTYCAQN